MMHAIASSGSTKVTMLNTPCNVTSILGENKTKKLEKAEELVHLLDKSEPYPLYHHCQLPESSCILNCQTTLSVEYYWDREGYRFLVPAL